MTSPNDTEYGAHESRIRNRSRRTILQALATSGSVAALGGIASAQEDGQDGGSGADTEAIPTAGEFPEGQTVGLQRVASNLPGPTDLDYVEVNGEVRHFIVTQTGQVFVTNLHDQQERTTDTGEEQTEAGSDEATTDTTDENATAETEAGTADGNATAEADAGTADGNATAEADAGTADGNVTTESDSTADGETTTEDDVEEFRFSGVVPGWVGLEPDEISDVENPTLELEAGRTYRFTWENGDGQPHNVVILDSGDNILERTEIIREQGETQTLEFEATEEMDRYVCEVHPGSMVGRIQIAGGESAADTDESASADGATPAGMDLFLDVGDRLVGLGIGELGGYDERGLLGIAFHPDFQENRRFFVRYSAPEQEGLGYNHTDVLAEYRATEDFQSADPESERIIMTVSQPQDNHNGGRLAFGPDGYLYTSYGDGGNVHDIGIGHVDDWYGENQGGNAQNTTENPLGGIHRIDVDADDEQAFGEYGIPDDNPLVDSEADIGSYWAWGFRNPWGMSIDENGQVFVGDAGQHRFESLYAVEQGGNYSWNVKEGSFCFSPASPLEPPADCPDSVPDDAGVSDARRGEALRDPIAEYQHTRISEAFIDSSVITGGHRYAGDSIPELEGSFVFGNWSSQGVAEADGEVLAAIDPSAGDGDSDGGDGDGNGGGSSDGGGDLVGVEQRWGLEELRFEGADDESMNRYVYGVERDEEGELYVLANTDYRPDPETGEIYKIVPAGEGEDVPAPEDPTTIDAGGEREAGAAEDGEAEDGEADDGAPQDGAGDGDEATDEEPENVSPEDTADEEAFPQDEGNETAGNETDGNETAGNDTATDQ